MSTDHTDALREALRVLHKDYPMVSDDDMLGIIRQRNDLWGRIITVRAMLDKALASPTVAPADERDAKRYRRLRDLLADRRKAVFCLTENIGHDYIEVTDLDKAIDAVDQPHSGEAPT